jgi:hypothetical protein
LTCSLIHTSLRCLSSIFRSQYPVFKVRRARSGLRPAAAREVTIRAPGPRGAEDFPLHKPDTIGERHFENVSRRHAKESDPPMLSESAIFFYPELRFHNASAANASPTPQHRLEETWPNAIGRKPRDAFVARRRFRFKVDLSERATDSVSLSTVDPINRSWDEFQAPLCRGSHGLSIQAPLVLRGVLTRRRQLGAPPNCSHRLSPTGKNRPTRQTVKQTRPQRDPRISTQIFSENERARLAAQRPTARQQMSFRRHGTERPGIRIQARADVWQRAWQRPAVPQVPPSHDRHGRNVVAEPLPSHT